MYEMTIERMEDVISLNSSAYDIGYQWGEFVRAVINSITGH